jgi:hypothetical protein
MQSGHCLCGQLRFEIHGDPQWVAYCHCASCRRHTGSPVTCFVNFRLETVSFSGELSRFHSSPGVTRSHCARCGTPIAYETEKRPGEIDLYVNAFDSPESFPPQAHAHYEERVPWFETRDDLPHV